MGGVEGEERDCGAHWCSAVLQREPPSPPQGLGRPVDTLCWPTEAGSLAALQRWTQENRPRRSAVSVGHIEG